jgi:hypothetical protein
MVPQPRPLLDARCPETFMDTAVSRAVGGQPRGSPISLQVDQAVPLAMAVAAIEHTTKRDNQATQVALGLPGELTPNPSYMDSPTNARG